MSAVLPTSGQPIRSTTEYPLNGSQNVIIYRSQNSKRSYLEDEEKNTVYIRKGSKSNIKPDSLNSEEDDENAEIEIPLLKRQKQKEQLAEPVKKSTDPELDVGVIRERLSKSSGYISDPSYSMLLSNEV